ncbi:MAG: hypothetical protein ISS63_15300 [Desulfobacteraceae bacterium]|nr:hypothetical protein [Desulfobacteraceae bacterium]
MDAFLKLTPVEAALLWIASDIEGDKNKEKPIVLASKSTLVLVSLLAEWAARSDENVLIEALHAIEKSSKKMAEHISQRGEYVRYDRPVRIFLEELSNSGFSILEFDRFKNSSRSLTAQAYQYGQALCESALLNLEKNGLLVDPPWYKILGIGALFVFLGSVPLEINVKTTKGKEVVEEVVIKAKLWEYESTSTNKAQNIHVNLKVAKFIDAAIGKLGKGFVEAWEEQNPNRHEVLKKEGKALLDYNPAEPNR